MQQRAPDQPRALAVRVPARQQRSRVSDQWDRVRLLEEVRYRRLRRHRRVPPRTAEERGQPDPPSIGSGDVRRGRSANRHDRRCVEIRRAAKTYRAGAQPHSRLHRFRQRCRQSGASRWQVPGSRHNRLSGASRRHRSTRATERRRRYRLQCLPRPRELSGTSGDSVASGSVEGAAPSNSTSPGSSGVVSDVTSVGSAGPSNPQPPPTAKGKSGLARAADQVRGFRRRLGSLPSDAAPHATPPRIPIDHEE